MSWARYDDELSMNYKIGRLRARGVNGIAALGLHLLANTYCRHNGTKGVVEHHVPELLVGRMGNKLAALLVDVGMFEACDDEWLIHDYAEFHDPNDPDPDKSAADRKRELSDKRASAGRLGGLAKAGNAGGKPPSNIPSKPEALLQQTSSPDPVPVPLLLSSSVNSSNGATGRDDDDRISFTKTIDILVEHKARHHPPRDREAWEPVTRADLIAKKGDQVRAAIGTGKTPTEAAGILIGDSAEAELAAMRLRT